MLKQLAAADRTGEIALENQLSPDHSMNEERRRCRRIPLDNPSNITVRIAGKRLACRLLDISAAGGKLKFQEEPPEGSVITIQHPQIGSILAHPVWTRSHIIGVKFDIFELDPKERISHSCP